MRKKVKTGVWLLLLLGSMHCFSQEKPVQNKDLKAARMQLIEGSTKYNPAAALAIYQKEADKGNAEAMNGLGLIYSRGMGVEVNESLGLEWFEKAGQNGYAKAYSNIALLYKDGVGTAKDEAKALEYYKKSAQGGYEKAYYSWGKMLKDGLGTNQDYVQAMEVFRQGAEKGEVHCLYGQGYLHYKGFGTPQDYNKAIDFFEQSADKGDAVGIYMLGYCYRNGYGVTIDEEKAKNYFRKSAALGFQRANVELSQPRAENAAPGQTKTVSAPLPEEVENAPTAIPGTLKKVKQKISKGDISGAYTGQLMRYDWSGQNILSKTSIKVALNQQGKTLDGIWVEQAGDSVGFKAVIDEKSIRFTDSKIDRANHYVNPTISTYQFNQAQLQIIENQGDLYIAGNLQLYNIQQRENEKPMYIILQRKDEQTEASPAVAAQQAVVSHMVVYPNPVTAESFNLSFKLKEQTPIKVRIYDLNGILRFEQQLSTDNTELQEQTIPFSAPSGNYILNLYYNEQVLRTILIKK
ncbi:T9SS type A sorting domain-containing protein [Flavobacterium sp. FlaQc-48]|uniref:T9SS type A sorting domain-containing protein n=1 Tax=Flavobacterium sp. FlaQc-48 TaxID=3374181 RepID=UPI003756B75A